MFAIETRIRKVVRDLIEPTVDRSFEDREKVARLQKSVDSFTERIEYMENIVIHDGRKLSVCEEIYAKIADNEKIRSKQKYDIDDQF